jgi:hypothetical protein
VPIVCVPNLVFNSAAILYVGIKYLKLTLLAGSWCCSYWSGGACCCCHLAVCAPPFHSGRAAARQEIVYRSSVSCLLKTVLHGTVVTSKHYVSKSCMRQRTRIPRCNMISSVGRFLLKGIRALMFQRLAGGVWVTGVFHITIIVKVQAPGACFVCLQKRLTVWHSNI